MEAALDNIEITAPVFLRVMVEANGDYDNSQNSGCDGAASSFLQLGVDKGNPHQGHGQLTYRLDSKNQLHIPYSIDIIARCEFCNVADLREIHNRNLIGSIVHALLYPAIRELVFTLSSRQPNGAFSIGFSTFEPQEHQETFAPVSKELSASTKTKASVRRKTVVIATT